MMCGTTGREEKVATTDVYIDKFIKYLLIPTLVLLGVIGLVILYLVDKIRCYNSASTRISKAEDFCWIDFQPSSFITGKWEKGKTMPHKIFPILLIAESISFLLPLLFWYWGFGRKLRDNITSLLDHVNILTDLYYRFDKGDRRVVSEDIHKSLDNILEFLLHVLTTHAKSTFMSFVIKWITLVLVSCTWFVGLLMIHLNEFIIFRDSFICLYNTDSTGRQIVAECSIPTATFLRAVWYLNIIGIGLMMLIIQAYIIDICRPKKYEGTFLYTSIPGCMDRRLAMCINKFYRSQYFSLLSKFCEINTNLYSNIGTSKTLSTKYGLLEGITPGRETIIDKHFPVIQPAQIDRFIFISELQCSKPETFHLQENLRVRPFRTSVPKKKIKTNKLKHDRARKIQPKGSPAFDQLKYIPPHILNRTLYKHSRGILNDSLQGSPMTNRSIQSKLTLEDLDFKTSTPENGRQFETRRQFSNNTYHQAYEYDDVHVYGHDLYDKRVQPVYPTRTRELDPYSYRLNLSLMKRKAENIGSWKP